MAQSFRQTEILQFARTDGRVLVEDMAARFGVSLQTIRRDLAALCDSGALARVHGGAVVTSGIDNLAYEARRLLAQDEKKAIGEAVAALIPDKASIFINIGTTTEEVAKAAGMPNRVAFGFALSDGAHTVW